MESELLNIFDKQGNHIGTATRHEVHQKGLWHETFHCWFISRENEFPYLYFQLRSKDKLDYPYLLDITAAGHLLSDESVKDGVRELNEELGLDISFEQLISIGKVDYTMLNGKKIDNEIANLFLYIYKNDMRDFKLQTEEVAGVVKVNLHHFISFWADELPVIEAEGFEVIDGERTPIKKQYTKRDFVQHGEHYFDTVLPQIQQYI